MEVVVWQVPNPVPPAQHRFKYRLAFMREGRRVVGYDNKRGNGDHRHIGASESRYRFIGIDTLVADFIKDVEAHT